MGRHGDRAMGNEGVGRFLQGTITERLWLHRNEGDVAGVAVAFAAPPITVTTLTDEVRRITDTVPQAESVTEVTALITAYTTTIPVITRNITGNVTVITDNVTVIG